MEDPVLIEVLRGRSVESRHAGAFAVVDADGSVVLSAGDIARPVFPRSAVKVIQALPLIESGAADRYGLEDAELALACASHSGEPAHVAAAAAMLRKAGLAPDCLECGTHWPSNSGAARALARAGEEPSALHNNCSGKHAGFLCTACATGHAPAGYVRAEHPVQEMVREALGSVTGAPLSPEDRGTDGCSIPTYPIPLRAMARGFARIGSGEGLGTARTAAAQRLRAAVAAHPFMVAGTGRADTRIMEALGARAFVKVGAEGVHCAALPELGLGIAIKCDDGAGRGAELVMATLLRRLLPLDDAAREALRSLAEPVLRNWNGIEVGSLRAAGPLAAA